MDGRRHWLMGFGLVLVLVTGSPSGAAEEPTYATSGAGTRELALDGVSIRMLVERANLGSDAVEVGQIHLPAGYRSQGHHHGAIEIFYVLSGVMDHVVNGVAARLTPGMVGMVRPEDSVSHQVVGEAPVEAVIIWAPGGEADRLAERFEVRPLD